MENNALYAIETFVFDLSIVRRNVPLGITGNYLKAIEASDIDANIDVSLTSSGSDKINIKRGRGLRGKFRKVYLSNSAQVGKTITILVAETSTVLVTDDGVVGDIDTIQTVQSIAYLGVVQTITNPIKSQVAPYGAFDIFEDGSKNPEIVSGVFELTSAAAALQSIYTVGAGKIFYLINVSLSLLGGDSGNTREGYLCRTDGATNILESIHLYKSYSVTGGYIKGQAGVVFTNSLMPKFVATQALEWKGITTGGTHAMYMQYRGLLVDT